MDDRLARIREAEAALQAENRAKAQALLPSLREPGLWLHTVAQEHSKSRSGGLPSLPDGVDWPINPKTGLALHFIAQIDLSALPATPLPGAPPHEALPRQGLLLFFFNFAAYWNDPFDAVDAKGNPNESRVLFVPAAGPDREPPTNLPRVHHVPEANEGAGAKGDNLLPLRHLRGYAIDTFRLWAVDDSEWRALPLFEVSQEAIFQSILDAAGEAAPHYPSWNAVPAIHPSCFTYNDYGVVRKRLRPLQMLGAEWWDSEPRWDDRVLLLESRLEADPLGDGALRFWIATKDLKAQRFERVFGAAHFS